MKEYKIIRRKFKWSKANEALEDNINNMAREGWKVSSIGYDQTGSPITIVLEREKNR